MTSQSSPRYAKFAPFVAACGRSPQHAASQRHEHKLRVQYAERLPGSQLHPLVVEVGGRWHPSVPLLLRRLAREYLGQSDGCEAPLRSLATGPVVSRWMARLSAALLRGNAAVHRRAGYWPPPAVPADTMASGPLAHMVPEGESSYELWVS